MPERNMANSRAGYPKSRRYLAVLLARARILKYAALSDCQNLHGKAQIVQPVLFSGAGTIVIGRDVTFGWRMSPGYHSGYGYVEARNSEARIEIGDNTVLNNNVSLICERSQISIGAHSLIGPFTMMLDSDGHVLEGTSRLQTTGRVSPIAIGANVLIGARVLILSGVTVGDGSTVGAGSVVTSSIPEGVVAAGVPADVIRTVES